MTITSRQNPLVARFREAARGDAGDVILLDGAHLIAEAIAAGIHIQLAAVVSTAEDVGGLVETLTRRRVEVAAVSPGVMDAISPVRSPSAIAALATRPSGDVEQLYNGVTPMVVIAVDVQDPGNVGAIARVAEAAGASGMIASGQSANPFGWKALRGSMGSALRLPIVSGVSTDDAIAGARRHGCRIVATVPRNGPSIFDIDLGGRIAVLIGGEGPGLPPSVVAGADEQVTVPMEAPVESLNAAVTAALIVYEVRRQRSAVRTRTPETSARQRTR